MVYQRLLGDDFLTVDECSIRKDVVRLSLPSVVEQALFMVVGVVSTIFAGRVGKEAVSAIGLVNVVINFIIVLFVALSTGCMVLVARLIGEENPDKAKEAVRQSVVIGAALSVIITIFCYIFSNAIIKLFFGRAENDVVILASECFKIMLYTFPLALINIIISGSMRGAGDARTPMIIANIVNIINIILGYTLIFGIKASFISLNGMGALGAAWSSALSRGIGGVLSIAALVAIRTPISINIFSKFSIDLGILKRMLNIGIPAALEQAIMQGGFLVLQMVISSMGTVAIAVYQIGMSISSICFVPIWGFGMAATTLTGQNLGARKYDIAEKCGWTTLKISVACISLLSVIIFIFSGQLVSVYNSDPEVIRIGASAIRIFCLSQPFVAVVVVISGSLRGAGDILYVMVTSFIGIWGFRILMTVLLNILFGMGIMGVWIALFFDFFSRSLLYMLRYRKGRWKSIVV